MKKLLIREVVTKMLEKFLLVESEKDQIRRDEEIPHIPYDMTETDIKSIMTFIIIRRLEDQVSIVLRYVSSYQVPLESLFASELSKLSKSKKAKVTKT